MKGMPFNLQRKGAPASARDPPLPSLLGAATNNATTVIDSHRLLWSTVGNKKEGLEPRSVLDHRSPSPPTSTSTLSSSLGCGGGGSTDSAGVAAVSDNCPQKWPGPAQRQPSQDTTAVPAPAPPEEGVSRKEDWASELHPIPVEIGLMGGEKSGLGVEDWDLMLSEATAVACSPGNDNSLLRWIMGESVDDSSVIPHKQQQQQNQQQVSSQSPMVAVDFDAPASGSGHGFGLVDPAFCFELIGGFGCSGGPNSAVGPSVTIFGSRLPLLDSNNGGGLRMFTVPVSSSLVPNIKPSCFGNNPTSIFPLSGPSSVASSLQQLGLPQAMFYQQQTEEKEQLVSHNSFLLNHQQAQTFQNPVFFEPLSSFAQPEHQQHQQHVFLPNRRRHHSMLDISYQINPKVLFLDSAQYFFSRRHQPQQQSFGDLQPSCYNIQKRPVNPKLGGDEALVADVAATEAVQQLQQQQTLKEQLFKAAEFIEAGNSVNAHGILARLNHQLSSPHGKPLLRSAFYFKEALNAIVDATGNSGSLSPSLFPKTLETPFDVVLKLSACKAFSEVSPVLQFTNFTCIQVLLEELGSYNCIHIIDFDIGIGGQWSSFMQELSQRPYSVAAAAPQLKITAFVTPSSHHPLELHLIRETLSHSANELNIPFEFCATNLEFFDPGMILNTSSVCNEAIAVNIPVGYANSLTPAILLLVRQLSPKIVVSVDHGCDCSDLSFSLYCQNALNSYTVLLESIDASGTSMDVGSKIEKFVMQPRIEGAVLGRYHAADKIGHWGTIFRTAGFLPLPFSNFTETQADCLLKKIQVRGFHVEKRQSSLLLFWQHRELVSVSAWRG